MYHYLVLILTEGCFEGGKVPVGDGAAVGGSTGEVGLDEPVGADGDVLLLLLLVQPQGVDNFDKELQYVCRDS